MNSNNPDLNTSTETFQQGATPVQSFASKAIPILPGTPLEARLGRPARIQMKSRQEGEKVCGDQPNPPSASRQ
jgi:hypothetical protein